VPNKCESHVIDTGCTDVDRLKQLSSERCDSENRQLAFFVAKEDCAPGLSKTAEFACCDPSTVVPAKPVPAKPAPDAQTQDCVTQKLQTVDASGACLDASGVKDVALKECLSLGLNLTGLLSSVDCGSAEVTCCK
jgi:hypothetical protein